MTPHIALISSSTGSCSRSGGETPVLIRVPAIDSIPHRGYTSRPAMGTRRVRRRLRREVRVTAFALLFAVPMSWALLTFVNMDSKAPESVAMASVVANPKATPELELETGPGVTISLEPSAIAYPENLSSEHPIVVPAGYLVPDHGPGDAVHEGD